MKYLNSVETQRSSSDGCMDGEANTIPVFLFGMQIQQQCWLGGWLGGRLRVVGDAQHAVASHGAADDRVWSIPLVVSSSASTDGIKRGLNAVDPVAKIADR